MNRRKMQHKLKPKRVILVACEGNNKTEKNYFNSFSGREKNYTIKIVPGNETDPLSLVRHTITFVKDNGLDLDDDDRAFCVFDTDTNSAKNKQIKKALELAKDNKIVIITSSPCIELWFLLHYKYTSAYMNNDEAINELRKFCPQYEKNGTAHMSIYEQTENAIKNAKKLEKNQKENGRVIQMVECNPHTEVYKIIEEFLQI